MSLDPEKEQNPFNPLDARHSSLATDGAIVANFKDADEALSFIQNHPEAARVASEGAAILEDPAQRKKLIRKIDMTVAPLLAAVYFLQFLDKTTLSYTAVMGIREDTHLEGQDYSDLSMLFYVGFLVAEFPTQYLAQHTSRLAMYLGTNIMIWGFVLSCHAACTSFAGLAIARTLLGVFESWYFNFIRFRAFQLRLIPRKRRTNSCPYHRNVVPERRARTPRVVVLRMQFAWRLRGIRGELCTHRLCQLADLLHCQWSLDNDHGWLGMLYFAGFAGQSKAVHGRRKGCGLTASEGQSKVKKKFFPICLNLSLIFGERRSGTQNSRLKRSQVFEAFHDPRIWLIFLATLLSSIPNGGISNFQSILLTTFGYTSRQALILNTPTGAVGACCVLLVGYLSDKWRDRSLVMLICIIPTILGAGLMIGLDPGGVPKNKPGLLAASFMTGTFGATFMILLAWNASNIAGHSKKVTANALTLVAFCAGNILGTQTFQNKQAPGYISGKISIIATLSALCLVVVVLRVWNDQLNKRKRKALAEMSEEEKEELRERMAFADQTDRRNVFFVYTH